jgi:hypothetical protein
LKESTHLLIKGYAGLKNMAEPISQYFPDKPIHVEPFAGLGRTIPFSKASTIILNDLSDYAVQYLREIYPKHLVTQEDFSEIIKRYRENPDVFLFLDPPWRKNIYNNNEKPVFTMKNVTQYYQHIFYWLNDSKTKCKWMLCSDRDRHEISEFISDIGYYTKELEHPTVKLYNRPIAVKLVTNYPLDNQMEKP